MGESVGGVSHHLTACRGDAEGIAKTVPAQDIHCLTHKVVTIRAASKTDPLSIMMRALTSLVPLDPNNLPSDGDGDAEYSATNTDVFLRGSTPSPMEQVGPTTTTAATTPEREYTIAVWVLSALLVVLSAVLVFVVVHIIYNHQRLRTLTFFPRRRLKAIQERIERRYETIEGWIISKRVQEHDAFCETCVKDFATFDEEEWIQKNATVETLEGSCCGGAPESPSLEGSDQAQLTVVNQTSATTLQAPAKVDLELESAQTGERECRCCCNGTNI